MPYSNIDKPSKYFNTITYTGTGASNARTGVGFQPDWVWIKGRSGATDHGLYDAVRGVQKQLESNTTTAETTETTGLTAFGTDGFTVGALAQLNTSSATYVAWNWLGANTTVSNTSGSITSTVSANTTSGFSIVSYTGNLTAGATVGHGLGVAPKMIIIINRSLAGTERLTYHASIGNGKYLALQSTAAQVGAVTIWGTSATTFTLAQAYGDYNGSGNSHIAYCFAEIKGFSKFGSYTGNGNANGPFVYTGFKPAFIMIKNSGGGATSSVQGWPMLDTSRSPFNQTADVLFANISNASNSSSTYSIDILSNGFKTRGTDGAVNESSATYIYMAFAENPFVSSTLIPTTAR